VAQLLETLAFECPTEQEAAALATTRGRVAVGLARLCCRLDEALAKRLTWTKHNKGATLCTVDVTSTALSPDERLLLDAAVAHIAAAGMQNSSWAAGRLRRATAVASQAASVAFAAHLANLSRRAHPTGGWRGAGPFQAQWDGARFQRYGPHDVLSQSAEEQEWRRRVAERFDAQPSRTDELCPWARVVTVFHACRSEEVALAICAGGFAALATLDPGFYGQGLYFSADAAYAAGVYGRQMRDEERAAGRGDGLVTVLVCDLAVTPPARPSVLSFSLSERLESVGKTEIEDGGPGKRGRKGSREVELLLICLRKPSSLPAGSEAATPMSPLASTFHRLEPRLYPRGERKQTCPFPVMPQVGNVYPVIEGPLLNDPSRRSLMGRPQAHPPAST
jgi:hypothetical protein